MTDQYDLIISKQGFNWDDIDIRNIDFNSSMALPQEKVVLTGYLDFDPGDTKKSLSLPHGLSFTPWYFPYFRNNTTDQEMMLPIFPTGVEGIGFPVITSRVNGTNVVFDVDFGIGWNVFRYYATDLWNTYSNNTQYLEIGREGSTGYNGAARFSNLQLTNSESLVSAKINLVTDWKLGSEPNYFRWVNHGINEDNTQSFNNPMGRPKTTATSTQQRTVPVNIGDVVEIDCLSMLNEIRSRSGWSSGNAMGFLMEEQDSINDSAMVSFASGGASVYMLITKSGTIRLYFKAVVLTEKII